jgi:hypothetical protein
MEIQQAESPLQSARVWLKDELDKRGLSGQQVHKLLHPLDKSALIRQGQVSNIRKVFFGRGIQDTIEKLAGNEFYQAYRILYPDAAKQHGEFLAATGLAIGEHAKASQEHAKCSRSRSDAQSGSTTQARTKMAKTADSAGAGARAVIDGSRDASNGTAAGGANSTAHDSEFAAAAQQHEFGSPIPISAEHICMASAEEVEDFMEGSGPGNLEKDWRAHGSSAGAGAIAPSTKKKSVRKPCGSCGELVENTLHCGRCKSTHYCNRKCQKKHWKSGHKQECQPPAEKLEPIAAVLTSSMEKMDLVDGAVDREGSAADREGGDKEECAICLDVMHDADTRKLPCGHVYHRVCIKSLRELGVRLSRDLCPQCRAPLPPGAEESFYQANVRLVRAQRMAKGNKLQEKLFAEAAQLLKVALHDDPQHAEAHHGLGFILLEHRQDIDGAEREFRAAIKCDPQYADAHFSLGILLHQHRHDIDGAVREYRAAIECNPQ